MTLDLTATATLRVNGVTLPGFVIDQTIRDPAFPSLFFYSNLASPYECPESGHFLFVVNMECEDGVLSISVDAYLRDFIPFAFWQWSDNSTDNPARFSLSCDPFHLHWEGNDQALGSGSDTPATLCGIDFGLGGTNSLVMDVVMP